MTGVAGDDSTSRRSIWPRWERKRSLQLLQTVSSEKVVSHERSTFASEKVPVHRSEIEGMWPPMGTTEEFGVGLCIAVDD
jgi:hypothetical protein